MFQSIYNELTYPPFYHQSSPHSYVDDAMESIFVSAACSDEIP